MRLEEKMKLAYQKKVDNFGGNITFTYPKKTIAISITGNYCELKCAHCNGKYLKGMKCIEDLQSIVDSKKFNSMLLSGGCDSNGKVALEKNIDELDLIKKNNIKVNAHIGLMGANEYLKIVKYIDVVSLDMVLDEETIKEVYGIDKKEEDYKDLYNKIKEVVDVVPHICIGLKGGKIKGEYKTIDFLSKSNPKAITFIVLIPTKGTKYESVRPPNIFEVADLISEARIKLPFTTINLGCMKPKGKYAIELEKIAILSGVNNIVMPNKKTYDLAKAYDLEIKIKEVCCSL